MYDEYGGEQAAYAAKYKSFTGASTVTDFYAYIDNTDPVWNDGPDRGNNHPVVNAYGVWKVGDPTAPVINLAHQPNQVTQLSKIVGEACWSGRGACNVSTGAAAKPTLSHREPLRASPHNRPIRRTD